MKIWVDDIREKPEDYDIWIHSTNECIDYIVKHRWEIDLLDLDHDAGDFYKDGGDYIKILDWLEEKRIALPIRIHSGNPVGINNMYRIIKKNHWVLVEYIYD